MTKDHCRRTSRSQDASDLLQLVRIHSWLEEEKQKKEEEEEGEAEEVYKTLSPKSTMRLFIQLVDKSQQRYVTALQLSCNLTHIYKYI